MRAVSMGAVPVLAASMLAGCVATPEQTSRAITVPAQYGRGDAHLNSPTVNLTPAPADADPAAPDAAPPVTASDGNGSGATTSAKRAAAATDPWWRSFGDPRLDRLVMRALSANSNLAAAGLTLRKARLQAGLGDTLLRPTASGNVDGSASRTIGQSDSLQRSYATGATLNWEIDLWGRLRAQRDVYRWEAAASAQDLQATELALAAEVCNDYWQLAYLNQSIAAGDDSLARLQRTLTLVQVQFDAGQVSKLELREAEQNLEARRSAQSALLQQRVQVRNALTVLLDGQPWAQADEPPDLHAATSPAPEPGLPADLLRRRPDLRAAELRLREALSQVKATARSYYPAFSLTGSMGTSSTRLADVLRDPVATLGAGLSLPFLNFNQARLDTQAAGTSYDIAATQFRTTLYTALGEVDTALSARAQWAAQVDSARKSYQAAREIERMYEVRYRAGAVSLRVWLDAQQTLRDSELSLASARLQQLDNDVTLIKALGGGA